MSIISGIAPAFRVPADDTVENTRLRLLMLTNDRHRQLEVGSQRADDLLDGACVAGKHQIVTVEHIHRIVRTVIRQA